MQVSLIVENLEFKEVQNLKIGDKEVEQIIVVGKDNEVVAVISDSEIIQHENYKVILDSAPCKNS